MNDNDTYLLQAKLGPERKSKYEILKDYHLRSNNTDMVRWMIDELWRQLPEPAADPEPDALAGLS